jgi:hypothetical protein
MGLAWTIFALLLISFFWLTHGGLEKLYENFQLLIDWFQQNA